MENTSVTNAQSEETENPAANGFGFVPIGKWIGRRLKWLIRDILPEEILAFLSAPAKAGKSTLVLYVALCLAMGKPLFGRYKTKKTTVLYYCLEDVLGEVKAKAKHMLQGKRFPKRLLVSKAPGIQMPGDFQAIKVDIEKSSAKVIIIDTLRSAHVLDENSSSEMAGILNPLRTITRSHKVAFIVIHHTKREIGDKKEALSWIRGTSDINAKWEVLMGLDKKEASSDTYIFHKYRSDFQVTYKTVFGPTKDRVTNDYPIVDLQFVSEGSIGGGGAPEARRNIKPQVWDAIATPSSCNALCRVLKSIASRKEIEAALQSFKSEGKAEPRGTGKNLKWHKIEQPLGSDVQTVTSTSGGCSAVDASVRA